VHVVIAGLGEDPRHQVVQAHIQVVANVSSDHLGPDMSITLRKRRQTNPIKTSKSIKMQAVSDSMYRAVVHCVDRVIPLIAGPPRQITGQIGRCEQRASPIVGSHAGQ